MSFRSNRWVDWWNSENVIREINWRKNMEIFIRSSAPILNFSSDDVVLDIGCGPGYLASFLKDRVKEMHCADVSARYLDRCKRRLAADERVYFYHLDTNDYTDLSFLSHRKFSLIICLSVIQYYRDHDEVLKLIAEVRRVALPGARFLIADIPSNAGKLSQVYGLLKTGLRESYLLESLRLLYRGGRSEYHHLHSSPGLLTYSVEQLSHLGDKLGLNARVLRADMTTNANRNHLLIQF